MGRIRISGRSDDIILVEGDVFGEWPTRYDHPAYVVAGDGTVLKAQLDDQGVWRLTLERTGSATLSHSAGSPDSDGTNDTDIVTLEGDIGWVGVVTTPISVPG